MRPNPSPSKRHPAAASWRCRFEKLLERLGLMPPSFIAALPVNRPFPDYVPCPHCNEPEVEVWCHERTARCHNCGHDFEHPPPPECQLYCRAEKRLLFEKTRG